MLKKMLIVAPVLTGYEIIDKTSANSFLNSRARRSNTGIFEEVQAADYNRE